MLTDEEKLKAKKHSHRGTKMMIAGLLLLLLAWGLNSWTNQSGEDLFSKSRNGENILASHFIKQSLTTPNTYKHLSTTHYRYTDGTFAVTVYYSTVGNRGPVQVKRTLEMDSTARHVTKDVNTEFDFITF